MSSGTWWHRTLVYLGLKEEPEEGYDELPEGYAALDHDEVARDFDPRARGGDVTVRPLRPAGGADVAERAPSVRAAIVEIRGFEDVESVGARYRTGQPVLFDAGTADGATARRVLDFVSGMTYLSRGDLAKVGSRAFLLVPDGVALPDDERRRLAGLGYRVGPGSEA
jgi:cell division inhibitor SepF